MFKTNARGILLDIEGTTSSISFVYDVMFPFARRGMRSYLSEHWIAPSVQQAVELLVHDLGFESRESWLSGVNSQQQQEAVERELIRLMDADIKATGLKQLQGMIWKSGFESGEMVAHLFDEVADSLHRWHEQGIDLRIYSSGSIDAQKMFFGHSQNGNLLGLLSGFYDTTTGPKQEWTSYQKIAGDFALPADQILFVSDVPAELLAASKAGMQAVLSIRPGNKPVQNDHRFEAIHSFCEIVTG